MPNTPKKDSRAGLAAKKAYTPPKIVAREQLESIAAVCSGPNAKEQGGVGPNGDCGIFGGQIKS